ncbi:MAG: efflux RND transporter periplasmic adaptor subunit [Bacteroidales bacterium]|jgi:multidrug efflux pump subunit AcrA (membrane-fusion protein)|nr:efflux RND transporter periplasmic adaptor subunit [Bacteroidales bacterium]
MKNIDRRIVILTAFLFIVGLAFGIMKFLIAQKEEPFSRPPVVSKRYVKTEKVDYTTIISPVKAPGRVNSLANVDIIAEASGKLMVSDIPLKTGAQFSKGDILFTVYPDEAALALKSRKSQFLNQLANLLPDIAIDFPNHETRFRNFFNAIDINQKLPEFPAIKEEKLKIFLSSRDILSTYYSILKDELQLSRHTIKAPFNGTYSDIYLEAGAYTNTGGRVAHAIRTDVLELEVPLDKFDAEWVKLGDPVTIHSETNSANWRGKVIRKSQFIDPQTQSQNIYIQVHNKKQRPLLIGEYLQVSFPGHPIPGAMEVPRNVVFNTNEVFVVENNRLKKKMINIIKLNEKTLIFNGLEKGELLVVQPLVNVQEGTLVEIHKDQPGKTSATPSEKEKK